MAAKVILPMEPIYQTEQNKRRKGRKEERRKLPTQEIRKEGKEEKAPCRKLRSRLPALT
jgi:hypothetical protein